MDALTYHCDNDQILIVQQFGNDTIRMHCAKLNLCGYEQVVLLILQLLLLALLVYITYFGIT